jgi:hypothetical protein
MTHQNLIQEIRAKGKIVPPNTHTRVNIIAGWVKLNKLMATPDKYSSKTFPDGLIKFEVKKCITASCGKIDIVQHQGICVECIMDYAYTDDLISASLSGECGMCGKVLKEKEQNPCARCCKMAMGDNAQDRRKNMQGVIDHCKKITQEDNK